MKNNYDRIAGVYDPLSRLIFRKAQLQAQTAQLKLIPPGSHILIAGGGTGWVLEEITAVHPSGLKITYVELSKRMLEMAAKRNTGTNELHLVHAAMEDFHPQESADVILTGFFFDNFTATMAGQLFDHLDKLLRPGGLWLFADFQYSAGKGKKWQLYLLKLMYFFFRYIAAVEASRLPDMERHFAKKNYALLESAAYYHGFIAARSYRRQSGNDGNHI